MSRAVFPISIFFHLREFEFSQSNVVIERRKITSARFDIASYPYRNRLSYRFLHSNSFLDLIELNDDYSWRFH